MSLQEQSYSVLVVSCVESFNTVIRELLPCSTYQSISFCGSISEAKRLLNERSFDFIVINYPLPDESGTRFAIDCCHSPTTVVLVVAKAEIHPEVHAKVATHGVFTLPKPTSRVIMMHALSWMSSTRERLRRLEKKTLSIEERMEEIRIINRAKFLLISELSMSEEQAHHYIEKAAMDNCISKKQAAQNIIKTYTI